MTGAQAGLAAGRRVERIHGDERRLRRSAKAGVVAAAGSCTARVRWAHGTRMLAVVVSGGKMLTTGTGPVTTGRGNETAPETLSERVVVVCAGKRVEAAAGTSRPAVGNPTKGAGEGWKRSNDSVAAGSDSLTTESRGGQQTDPRGVSGGLSTVRATAAGNDRAAACCTGGAMGPVLTKTAAAASCWQRRGAATCGSKVRLGRRANGRLAEVGPRCLR